MRKVSGQFLRGSARSRASPYHPIYAGFAPAASTNDSELQSLSSDAISDDTMSLTDSSVDGFSTRKTHKKKMNQVIRNNMQQNGRLNTFPEIPLMHRPPRDHIPHAPNDFAKVLIEKLKVLENKQIQEDKLNARLRKVEKDPNSILDDHLHRVFDDSAKQSPSGRSSRSRSRSPDHALPAKLSQITNSSVLPQTLPHGRNSHKGQLRQKNRETGFHLTEIAVDTAKVHHHHH
ncbi:putative axin-1 [Apostichopus japonicus]|uniref:Putative axin-1 n=1 Tax=Stichopus japonicus TaxID=307972 RepID=A0A2G8LJP9_STIJA|nr:putative axin-1 [Apostichopus japonicus]